MHKNKKFTIALVMISVCLLAIPFFCLASDSASQDLLRGDVNGDGNIDLVDVEVLRRYLADVDLDSQASSFDISSGADANSDGVVDSRDLVLLRKYLVDYDYENGELGAPLSGKAPQYTYTSGDGAVTLHYSDTKTSDFENTRAYYELCGYEQYCYNRAGELVSATYTKESRVLTVTFNGRLNELYLTQSENGAEALPEVDYSYDAVCETAITQHYSPEINGMGYFIRLSDGSFVVIDGGYDTDVDHAYDTLCQLNGSEEGIHIRAWLITHSHGDHYSMFSEFSKKYAENVKLDTLLYSPIKDAPNQNNYLNNGVKADVACFNGAQLCPVRTGMSFNFADVTLEILETPEQVYKSSAPADFNETSVVTRVKNSEGSMIFLGDCGAAVCNWLVNTYGESLKSDMVQVSHHGCETATAAVYDNISAHTVFWPCNEALMNTYRGELVKQHILEAEYSKEHILQSYGNVTRPLSHKANVTYIDVFPSDASLVSGSGYVSDINITDGALRYTVAGTGVDPYVSFKVNGVKATKYNAVKIVMDAADISVAGIFFRMSTNTGFVAENYKAFGTPGTCNDGKMTVIVFLGDVAGYKGNLTHLRIDCGTPDTVGQTVDIYSIEMYYIDID